MATATYTDYMARHPYSSAPRETVEALLDDVAAEISARCDDRGTTYEELVASREGLVLRIECAAAYRMCSRSSVGGVPQDGLQSFSQTVGDHRWDFGYSSGNGNNMLLNDELKALGLSGQQVGWLGVK